MYYKSFYIKNLKGIDEVSIDLRNNRIFTLVGLNESGKTTILKGIEYFYKFIQLEFSNKEFEVLTLNELRPKGLNFTGEIVVSAVLRLESEDIELINTLLADQGKNLKLKFPEEIEYKYSFNFSKNEYKDKRIDISCDIKTNQAKIEKTLKEKAPEVWDNIIKIIIQHIIPEVLYYEDFTFDIPEQIEFKINQSLDESLSENATDNGKRNILWKNVLDDVLASIDKEVFSFQEYVVNRWNIDNDTAINRISTMEARINNVITEKWKDLFKSNDPSKPKYKPNFAQIKLIPNASGEDVYLSFRVVTEGGRSFAINDRSKGFKWFFSFLLFTEFRKNRSRNILFLLDEPASNLHSSAQLKILEAIDKLSDVSMVIYSTHSNHLINTLWLNGAYIVINEAISEDDLIGGSISNDDGAKISARKYFNYVASIADSNPLFFQPILDKLQYAPSQIEPIPNITITEGKYDWYTFKYFSEIILKNTYKFNFYPGKGRNTHSDIIRLYLAWGKHFIVILDGDEPGIASKEDYKKEFEGFTDNVIYTLEDIFSKKIVTEDLITNEDKQIICDFKFESGTYNKVKDNPELLKSKLNFAINLLLLNKEEVNLSEETKTNFQRLFTFIESKFKEL